MFSGTVLKRHTVLLDFDASGTYPTLVVKDGDVVVLRLGIHPDQATEIARLMAEGIRQAQSMLAKGAR